MIRLASRQARLWFHMGDYPPQPAPRFQTGCVQNGDTGRSSSERPSLCRRHALNPRHKDGSRHPTSVVASGTYPSLTVYNARTSKPPVEEGLWIHSWDPQGSVKYLDASLDRDDTSLSLRSNVGIPPSAIGSQSASAVRAAVSNIDADTPRPLRAR